MKSYSRLARFEERKNIRSAVILGIITIGLIVVFFFFGLTLVAKFAGFLTDLRKSSSPVENSDTTPPAPPHIVPFPEATSKDTTDISGTSEPGATVKLTFNGESEEVIANNKGEFTFTLKLVKGENQFFLIAKDESGNESQKTETAKIIFDNDPPSLDIESPKDGDSFYGSKQRQIVIKGKTDDEANLTINDRFVLVENDGSFTFATTLSEGENSFNLKAKDKADNLTEKTIKVNFTP